MIARPKLLSQPWPPSLLPLTIALLVGLGGACGDDAAPMPDDLLDGVAPFVAVPRASTPEVATARRALSSGAGSSAAATVAQDDTSFYLAIRKDVLDQPWFLSAYVKQLAKRAFAVTTPFSTLGTRVVSFQVQNDKLFVFDVSGQRTATAVNDPSILLEAYPIVDLPSFSKTRGADRYVLVDPSAGLNPFGITSDQYNDPGFGQATYLGAPIQVGLAFMQHFRALADGVAFEEVFTGDVAGADPGPFTVWGTLGLSLRRYSVGDGYVPTPDPGVPFFFKTGDRLIPDSGGGYTYATPLKWNFHPGMTPVKIFIGAGAARAQADFPSVDVMGAFKRGVESWNDVFGYPVFQAVFVDDDAVRDDDASFLLVDYPGTGYFYNFADQRANPINGEIRAASVYFTGIVFQDFAYLTDDAPAGAPAAAPASAAAAGAAPVPAPHSKSTVELPTWAGLAPAPACVFGRSAEVLATGAPALGAGGAALTADEKRSHYIQWIVAHEFGHALGLRHNFAGSLEPPTSSVMDYLPIDVAGHAPTPGPYDRDAIHYLYGMSAQLPAHPFCTDREFVLSPLCQTFDEGADPLYDIDAPGYHGFLTTLLDGSDPPDAYTAYAVDAYLNAVLAFARDPGTIDPAERTAAVAIALERTGVPMSAADLASPTVVARANAWAETILRRMVLDDPSLRGRMYADITDPDVLALIASQAGRMLRDEDGARAPALRRTAVDLLKRLQSQAAFDELVASRDAIQAALAAGGASADDAPFVEDVLTRIDVALAPYFD